MPVSDVSALIQNRVQTCGPTADTGLERAGSTLRRHRSVVMAGCRAGAGAGSVTLVYSSINSGSETQGRAQVLADAIGARLVVHDLTATYGPGRRHARNRPRRASTRSHRAAHRRRQHHRDRRAVRAARTGYLRMTGNGLRHGTGNECEDRWPLLSRWRRGGLQSHRHALQGEVFHQLRAR